MDPWERYEIHYSITFRCTEDMIGEYSIKLVVDTRSAHRAKIKTIIVEEEH